MNPRVFHYSDGPSHKFWSISVEGSVQTVCFGRIGTAGQKQAKTFETGAEAETATEKLIREKIKKGYAEVAPEAARLVAPKKRTPKRAYQQLLLPF